LALRRKEKEKEIWKRILIQNEVKRKQLDVEA